MIRSYIDPNIENLNRMSKIYDWIPNSNSIRPNQTLILIKQNKINQIINEWNTLKDYILYDIFSQKAKIDQTSKKYIKSINHLDEYIFKESEFKYNLNDLTNHYILWFSLYTFDLGVRLFDEDFKSKINQIITKSLTNITKSDNFNFVWYVNPKPCIIDFFHVQVFWT